MEQGVVTPVIEAQDSGLALTSESNEWLMIRPLENFPRR